MNSKYLFHTTDSTEKTDLRISTKAKAEKVMESHREDFADNITMEITGWNDSELTYTVVTESKEERDRIITQAQEGKTKAEYVSNHKADNMFNVLMYTTL